MSRVCLSTDDDVARIELDSAENRNALSRQLLKELAEALRSTVDSEAKVVLISANGPAFCAGLDLKEAAGGDMSDSIDQLVDIQRQIATHPAAIVVRVDGPVRAGGIGILSAADIVFCSDTATFALPEARLGLAPAAVCLTLIPRAFGRGATRHLLSGSTFTAAEAVDIGLVTEATAPSELEALVEETIATLRTSDRVGLRETKRILNEGLVRHLDAGRQHAVATSSKHFDAMRKRIQDSSTKPQAGGPEH